jgi:hypothetical protein
MVQVGANLSITPQGVLSAPAPAAAYQLPTASETVLGGIKVGDNLTIDPDGILNAAASSGGGGGSAIVFLETPYEIEEPYVSMAWTSVAGQGEWANSGATTLVVKAETFDQDTGGNTSQSLKARTSATSTIEVDIITHEGTSNARSVVSEQALMPCAEDGSFEYYWARTTTNGKLRSFKVVGYMASAGGSGGGGSAVSRVSSGFQRTNCMDAPSVLTGTNGQQWVYTVSYGGSSTGYHMSMFDIDGTFIGHLFPNSAAGNSNAPSWPYHHTASWGSSWPQTWIDGSMGLDSGYAIMWVKHSATYLFSMRLNLTTGQPDLNWGQSRNNQPAGDYWATEGVYAAGGNAFGDHWNIIGQDAGNMIMAFGYESTAQNYANGTQIYMMTKGSYNAPYASYRYTGVTKYLPQCTNGLNVSNTASQHNLTYILVAGINPTSGRVYLHRRGADDVMTVMQISQANGTGPSRWYRAFHSMLKTSANQPNTGTYKLNYVGQFAIPDAINSAGGNQTVGYQVQFTTPTTANPDAVPTYLTRGGHWANWNYGGAQVIPWQTSWET